MNLLTGASLLALAKSIYYLSLRLFVSFVKEIASPSRGWREGLVLVIAPAARFFNLWSLFFIQVTTQRVAGGAAVIKIWHN